MKTVVFDTETTDITPGQICQLSYLIINDKDIEARNYYFEVDYINPYAAAINGFTIENLRVKSNGKKFNDCSDNIFEDFKGTDLLICHNVEFDKRFIVAEFNRCGIEFNTEKTFCTMKNYTNICKLPFNNNYSGKGKFKWPKLIEVTDFMNISNQEITSKAKHLYSSSINGEHDSRFDSVATLLCYEAGISKGYFQNPDYSCALLEYSKMKSFYIPKTNVTVNKSIKLNVTPINDPFDQFYKDSMVTTGIRELIKYWISPKEGSLEDRRKRLEEIERMIHSENKGITRQCLYYVKAKYSHYYKLNAYYLDQLEEMLNKQEIISGPQIDAKEKVSYHDIEGNTSRIEMSKLHTEQEISNDEENNGCAYLFIAVFLIIILLLLMSIK